jgi:hypothetical protein
MFSCQPEVTPMERNAMIVNLSGQVYEPVDMPVLTGIIELVFE